jgi:hypothetical protein
MPQDRSDEARLFHAALNAVGFLSGQSIMSKEHVVEVLVKAIKGSSLWPNNWRAGVNCTPKMRDHALRGQVGIVVGVLPEGPSIKECLRILLDDGQMIVEPSDEWMTAQGKLC